MAGRAAAGGLRMGGMIAPAAPLGAAEERQAGALLLTLLRRQIALWTAGGGTSVPEETAQALLSSLRWQLRLEDGAPPARWRAFLADPEAAFAAGLRRAARARAAAETLWRAACLETPADSACLRDTLRAVGAWLRSYDARFLADRVPEGIDYPLCVPVAARLAGPDYVRAWLLRLRAENALLRAFPPAAVRALLDRAVPLWRTMPLNMAEPVAVNALGRALLGLEPRPLALGEPERAALRELLAARAPAERRRLLAGGTARLCASLGLPPGRWRAPLCGLAPRLDAALAAGDLAGIFIDFT